MEPTTDEIVMMLVENPDLLREVVDTLFGVRSRVLQYTDIWMQVDAERTGVLWNIAIELVDALVTGIHEASIAERLILEWENAPYSEMLPEWYNQHYRDVLLGFVEDALSNTEEEV